MRDRIKSPLRRTEEEQLGENRDIKVYGKAGSPRLQDTVNYVYSQYINSTMYIYNLE